MDYNWEDKVIMIVEDAEMNYILLERILRKTKVTVIWQKNGKLAVDYVKENNKLDIVLMDLRMPIMDGSTATKLIKEMKPDLPVIIQTASVMGSDFEDIKHSGCDDQLFKPINVPELFAKINNYFIL